MKTKQAAANPLPGPVTEVLRGGDRVVIRPIRASDMQMERRFIENLSPQSRRFRFLETLNSPSDDLLHQLTAINPLTDVAFVAVIDDIRQDNEVGVGRFGAVPGSTQCEFALVVAEAWREKGLGTLLMRHLIDAARAMGMDRMYSSDASDNELMRKFASRLRLDHRRDPADTQQILYSLQLTPVVVALP